MYKVKISLDEQLLKDLHKPLSELKMNEQLSFWNTF